MIALLQLALQRIFMARGGAQLRGLLGAEAVRRAQLELACRRIDRIDSAGFHPGQLDCIRHDRRQHRLQIQRRVHRARHLAEGAQLGDRAFELAGLCLQRIQQPRVLDRDRRLLGEVLDPGDLPLIEGLNLIAIDAEKPDELALPEQRHVEEGARADELDRRDAIALPVAVSLGLARVENLNGLAAFGHARQRGFGRLTRVFHVVIDGRGRQACAGRREEAAVRLTQNQHAGLGFTDANHAVDDKVEHRGELAGRLHDQALHLRGRGLLLERFGKLRGARLQLVEQMRVRQRDCRLVGEIFGKCDLPLAERLDRAAIKPDDAEPLVLEHRHIEKSLNAHRIDREDAPIFAPAIEVGVTCIDHVDRLAPANDLGKPAL